MLKISFLIVNYYTSVYLSELITSIYNYIKDYGFEVLIFDNSCNTKEKKIIEELKLKYNQIQIFSEGNNIGFVKANNYLFERAHGELIILLNPDTLLFDDSIKNIFNFIELDNSVGVAGPMLLNYDRTYQTSFYKFPTLLALIQEHILLKDNAYSYNTDITQTQDCDVVKGACLVFKKSFIKKDKIFDEAYEMYSEEVDFCKYARNNNKRVVYFPHTKIIHYGEKSSTQENISEYALQNYYRSKFIYFKKYFGKKKYYFAEKILFISLLEKIFGLFLFNKKRSAMLHFKVYIKLRKNVKNMSNM